MSETQPPPADVHVDTPEQAAARQLVDTYQRVTHVVQAAEQSEEQTDFSLVGALTKAERDALVKKVQTHVQQQATKETKK